MVEKVQHHYVFHRGGRRPQLPIEQQVAIGLYRYGGYGKDVASVAEWAGVSEGMVCKATERFMVALASLHDEVIYWPNEEQKEEAKQEVEKLSCKAWRNGYIMVDGSLVELFQKPHLFGEAYYDRKSNYSLNVQIVNLPNKRIVDYVVGHTGSRHDSAAFKDSKTMQNADELFKAGGEGETREFCWCDSAYPLEDWASAPFKQVDDSPDNRTFNYHVSAVRIKSEHCIGALKGQWQSMKYLRQQIHDERSHHIAVEWCRTAIILYQLVWWIVREPEAADEWAENERDMDAWMNEVLQQEREQEREPEPAPPSSEEVEAAVLRRLEEVSHLRRQSNKPPYMAGQRKRLWLREHLFESRRAERRGHLERRRAEQRGHLEAGARAGAPGALLGRRA
jgi:hypothetical protein